MKVELPSTPLAHDFAQATSGIGMNDYLESIVNSGPGTMTKNSGWLISVFTDPANQDSQNNPLEKVWAQQSWDTMTTMITAGMLRAAIFLRLNNFRMSYKITSMN